MARRPGTPSTRPQIAARFLPAWLFGGGGGGGGGGGASAAGRDPAAPPASASASAAAAAAPTAPPPTTTPPPPTTTPDADYEALLEKGRARTLSHPPGQLQGRAGRRCTLEDGERYLSRCVAERPADLRAHVLLMRNLMRQATGREGEVPGLALAALRQAVDASGTAVEEEGAPASPPSPGGGGGGVHGQGGGLEACSAELLDPTCVPALQVVLLALKALHAQQPPADVLAAAAREQKGGGGGGLAGAAASAAAAAAASSPSRPPSPPDNPEAAGAVSSWRARRLRAFVEAAGDVVPGLAREFSNVERRLAAQLDGLGHPEADARLRALVSREWLSAVDLAPPCGVVG